MRAVRAAREEHAIPDDKLPLAVRRLQRRSSGDDDEQLVVPELVVVRKRALTGGKLDQARAQVLARDALATPDVPRSLRRPRSWAQRRQVPSWTVLEGTANSL